MQNFQDVFETRKRSFINAFSICMTVPLKSRERGCKILETRKIFSILRLTPCDSNYFAHDAECSLGNYRGFAF